MPAASVRPWECSRRAGPGGCRWPRRSRGAGCPRPQPRASICRPGPSPAPGGTRRRLAAVDRGDRGDDRAAPLMAEHDDQPGRLIAVWPELDAAEYHLVVHRLPAGPEHEQVPDAAVEDDLGRNARIDAGEDQGERILVG